MTTFSAFIKALQKDPATARRTFLAFVGKLTKAENSYLLIPGEAEKLSFWKKRPGLPDLQLVLAACENLTKDVITLSARNSLYKILILRLKWQDEKFGAVFLLFKKKKRRPLLSSRFQELCRIFALWESTNQLRALLRAQQQSLQSLSAESAAVAEDYVRLTQQMMAGQNRMQSITKGILRTQEEERAKISRDLHDGIGQELTALKMNLDVLTAVVQSSLSEEHRDRWSEARTLAEQTLQDVRELSRLLRPRMLDDLGLFPTLRWYVRNFSKRMNIPVELSLDGDEQKLNSDIQTILFRVVQEALNNVAKHAHAKFASVHLQCQDQEARLKVIDDGVGFHASQRSAETSSGLAGMRDRVVLYKGSFAVQSAPEKGTRLEILIPLS